MYPRQSKHNHKINDSMNENAQTLQQSDNNKQIEIVIHSDNESSLPMNEESMTSHYQSVINTTNIQKIRNNQNHKQSTFKKLIIAIGCSASVFIGAFKLFTNADTATFIDDSIPKHRKLKHRDCDCLECGCVVGCLLPDNCCGSCAGGGGSGGGCCLSCCKRWNYRDVCEKMDEAEWFRQVTGTAREKNLYALVRNELQNAGYVGNARDVVDRVGINKSLDEIENECASLKEKVESITSRLGVWRGEDRRFYFALNMDHSFMTLAKIRRIAEDQIKNNIRKRLHEAVIADLDELRKVYSGDETTKVTDLHKFMKPQPTPIDVEEKELQNYYYFVGVPNIHQKNVQITDDTKLYTEKEKAEEELAGRDGFKVHKAKLEELLKINDGFIQENDGTLVYRVRHGTAVYRALSKGWSWSTGIEVMK